MIFPMIVALDFDNTISPVCYDDFSMDTPPSPECIRVLNELHDLGCYLILWTCRSEDGSLGIARDYLKKWNIPIDLVNANHSGVIEEWGESRKIFAHVYHDDQNASGLLSWQELERSVLNHPYWKRLKEAS